MKKIVCLFCFFLFFAGGFVVNAEESYSNAIPIYRLYHSGVKEHLFTSDKNEYNVLSKRGWIQEGISWYAPTSGEKVTRLYSKVTRKHLYSTDQNEIRTLLATKNWTSDGVVFLSGGSYGIYRLYHPGVKTHLSTVDANEFQVLGGRGWYQEGVSFKAEYLPSSFSGTSNVVPDLFTWSNFSRGNAIENNQGVSVKIYSQSDLNAYLSVTGNDLTGDVVWFYNTRDIFFPKGNYYVDKGFMNISYPSSSGNIDFNGSVLLIGDGGVANRSYGNQFGRTLKNLTIYGTAGVDETYNPLDGTYVNPYTRSSKCGGFYFSLFRTTNMNFENLVFNNAHGVDGHVFDVVGGQNIKFDKTIFRGSAFSKTVDMNYLKNLATKHIHSVYSEAIQIDSSYEGSLGNPNTFNGRHYYFDIWKGLSHNGEPARDIKITNSEFSDYKGNTGLGMIRNIKQEVYKFGAGIGGHSTGNSSYTGILIDNVLFKETIYVNGLLNNELAPIKFLTVEAKAMNLVGSEKISFISNSFIRKHTDISVRNVRFVNTKTSGYYNKSGVVNNQSVWFVVYQNQ